MFVSLFFFTWPTNDNREMEQLKNLRMKRNPFNCFVRALQQTNGSVGRHYLVFKRYGATHTHTDTMRDDIKVVKVARRT